MFRRFTTTKEKKKDKEGRQFRYEKVKKQNKGEGVAKMQQVNEEGERGKLVTVMLFPCRAILQDEHVVASCCVTLNK